jgi:hypothetical protein
MFDDMSEESESGLNEASLRKRQAKLLSEVKEVSMTPALKMLLKTREKKVVDEVDYDFANMRDSADTRVIASTMATS